MHSKMLDEKVIFFLFFLFDFFSLALMETSGQNILFILLSPFLPFICIWNIYIYEINYILFLIKQNDNVIWNVTIFHVALHESNEYQKFRKQEIKNEHNKPKEVVSVSSQMPLIPARAFILTMILINVCHSIATLIKVNRKKISLLNVK